MAVSINSELIQQILKKISLNKKWDEIFDINPQMIKSLGVKNPWDLQLYYLDESQSVFDELKKCVEQQNTVVYLQITTNTNLKLTKESFRNIWLTSAILTGVSLYFISIEKRYESQLYFFKFPAIFPTVNKKSILIGNCLDITFYYSVLLNTLSKEYGLEIYIKPIFIKLTFSDGEESGHIYPVAYFKDFNYIIVIDPLMSSIIYGAIVEMKKQNSLSERDINNLIEKVNLSYLKEYYNSEESIKEYQVLNKSNSLIKCDPNSKNYHIYTDKDSRKEQKVQILIFEQMLTSKKNFAQNLNLYFNE